MLQSGTNVTTGTGTAGEETGPGNTTTTSLQKIIGNFSGKESDSYKTTQKDINDNVTIESKSKSWWERSNFNFEDLNNTFNLSSYQNAQSWWKDSSFDFKDMCLQKRSNI